VNRSRISDPGLAAQENCASSEIPPDVALAQQAVALAEDLLHDALTQQRPSEESRARQIAGLIADPAAKGLSIAMTDRLFRSADPNRAAKGWCHLLAKFGLPRGFGRLDRALLRAGVIASSILPEFVMAGVQWRLRHDSRGVILPAEAAALEKYLTARRLEDTRVNVNPLGEAILGEEEAARRLDAVLALLARPDVDYVSVKISAIFSQINLVAWEVTLAAIKTRLRRVYRAALAAGKFVNLDMEEYRDLALTVAAFREVLDEPEFHSLRAGLALQAYLPDSCEAQRELTAWARHRTAAGGAPIKLRLVKGANLAMELVEAELHGWHPAPYPTKADTDANFRRMLEFACRPANAASVRIGVGSHNLFDVALALVLREAHGVRDAIEIEMLEGMANHQARAVRDEAGGLLVYAPVVHERDFGSALAYLIRRLDENTAPENFLSDLFALTPGSDAWQRQKARFIQGWNVRHALNTESRRKTLPTHPPDGFANEPDTDWTQARHRNGLQRAIDSFRLSDPPPAPDISAALDIAKAAQPAWEALGDEARAALLRGCADAIAAHRMETIALMRDDGKKAIGEADVEVTEAIDFARYYAATGAAPSDANAHALGVMVVAPPWNFPFAIPAGGVFAALMAGNSVILKPARVTARTAWSLVQQLWEAGIPRDVLQFVACPDAGTGRSLITDPRTDAVVLTGAYETARMFQDWRPSLRLFAETSGKNSIVVSALADRDLAIRDIVRSAFGHAGQKCSAASLAILEAEVYDDPGFRRRLRDAAASLHTGSAVTRESVVTPLIREPGPALHRALTTLDDGETWLLEPRGDAADPCLWSPGIKLGVKPGSWFHQTECFGPVLGVMRARDLDEAVAFQNGVSYGLTAGFHSLDEDEIAAWKERVEAGNLYVNRAITGAIVQRQPFGGWKRSAIGPGAKAGGPNYVNLFRRFKAIPPPDFESAATNYRAAWLAHFSQPHDPSALRCESNVFRYRPCRGVILRLEKPDAASEALARLAADVCGVSLEISSATEESDTSFATRLPGLARHAEFLRTFATPADEILRAAHAADMNWIDAPLSTNGRLELTRWLREQSVSETRHRYGNLIAPASPTPNGSSAL
jgi:RHH-type proline utilization regulon transcriptional repressor/proline dehydrogenase/delta 1-pyrroline-5-carboxylate dehydrogenase